MQSDNMRAALLMMAGTGAFTVNDVFLKMLGAEMPLFQVLVLRGIIVSLIFGAFALRAGMLHMSLSPRDRKLVLLRATAEAGAAYFFITALFNMPIANLTAILQVLPLSVALAAYLFLREPLGWRRMSAILIGFVGVMLIVRPGFEGFTVYSVMALVSVGFVTVRDLTTRMLSTQVPSVTVAFTTALGVTLFGAVGSMTDTWVTPSAMGLVWLAGATGFVVLGYLFVIMAMRAGELTFAAPFRYASLLFALVLGWLVFEEWPDTLTFVGSAIIVATGVYTLYRENRLKRAMRGRPPLYRT